MKIDRRRSAQVAACALATLVLATPVVLAAQYSANRPQSNQAASIAPLPADMTAGELGQWCVNHDYPEFRQTLTVSTRNFLRSCVELWGTPAPTTPPVTQSATTPPAGTTTPPASTSPVPTSSASSSQPGPVVHGRDINRQNTGYLAWVGGRGERCTDITLKVYTTKVNASALGATATCVWLKGGINVDAPITLVATRIQSASTSAPVIRADGPKLTIQWSTIDGGGTNGTYGVGGRNVDVYRSQIFGSSDGVRFEGMNIIESFIRTALTSPADHNDGIQAYMASSGGSILRCNIDSRPGEVNGGSDTAPIFLADDSQGEAVIRDNLLAGGGYSLRLHEAMKYRVTGNVIVDKTWGVAPVSTENAVAGAFVEWANNTTSTGTVLNP